MDRQAQERNVEIILLIGILSIALLLRLYPIDQYHGWDESSYLQYAEHIAYGKNNYGEFSYRPPILPLLLASFFLLWHSAYVASILVALLSTSVCLAVYWLGKRLLGSATGLFSAALLATQPVFVATGHLILTDAIASSFVAFSALLLLSHKRFASFFAGVLVGMAALTKFTCFMVVLPFGAIILWRERHLFGPLFWQYVLGSALVIVPYLAWCWHQFGTPLKPLLSASALLPQHGPPWWFYLSSSLLSPLTIAGLLLFALFLFKRDFRLQLSSPTLVVLSVWIIVIGTPLLLMTHKEHRFILPAIVPLFILAGCGLSAFFAFLQRRWFSSWPHAYRILFGTIVFLLLVATSASSFERLDEPPTNQWVPPAVLASMRIVSDGNTSAPVYATSDYPVLGYYTPNRIIVIDGPRFENAYPLLMPRPGYLVIPSDRTQLPTVSWADQRTEMRVMARDEYVVYWYTPPSLLR